MGWSKRYSKGKSTGSRRTFTVSNKGFTASTSVKTGGIRTTFSLGPNGKSKVTRTMNVGGFTFRSSKSLRPKRGESGLIDAGILIIAVFFIAIISTIVAFTVK